MVDIAIIGGGPAGLSAGLYAARGGVHTVLLEEVFVGGQAAKTVQIDNYPGFAEGVSGSELGMRMEQQAARFGLQIKYDPVKSLELQGDIKKIITTEETISARAVIYCTGASPRKLGIAREDELEGMGISYCATCDGAFFKGREVAVVGGGDTALADTLYLARFASKVYLVHRRDQLRGGIALQKAVFALENVQLVWSSIVVELLGDKKLAGIQLQNVIDEQTQVLPVAALFVAIGTQPRTELVKDQLSLSEGGYIQTDIYMHTSLPGVFAAGDVRETPLRQVVTAVADGAVAATQALDYINTRGKAAHSF